MTPRCLARVALLAAAVAAVTPTSTPASTPDPRPFRGFVTYHGGPVVRGTLYVQPVYYGNWTSTAAVGVMGAVDRFLRGVDSSRLWGVLASYPAGRPSAPLSTTRVKPLRGIVDAYSVGGVVDSVYAYLHAVLSPLSTSAVRLPQNATPRASGVADVAYVFMASEDVYVEPRSRRVLSWAYHGFVFDAASNRAPYAVVGFIADENAFACAWPRSAAAKALRPPGATYAVYMLAHELFEMVTDPLVGYLPGYLAREPYNEIADICERQSAPSTCDAYTQDDANTVIGGEPYFMPLLYWNNGSCVLEPPPSPSASRTPSRTATHTKRASPSRTRTRVASPSMTRKPKAVPFEGVGSGTQSSTPAPSYLPPDLWLLRGASGTKPSASPSPDDSGAPRGDLDDEALADMYADNGLYWTPESASPSASAAPSAWDFDTV